MISNFSSIGRIMGWTFRKSFNLGPFRINLSKGGISYSVGIAGFRWGVDTKGKSYKSVNVPGTGFNYRSSGAKKKTTTKKTKPEADE